jgi:hypothetical protein
VAHSSQSVTESGEDVYLIGIWAVTICTIIGPIAFSWLVKRQGETIVHGKWGAGVVVQEEVAHHDGLTA